MDVRDTKRIVSLPSPKLVEDLFRCVRCKQIPNPVYHMVCKENGHYLCGSCAWFPCYEVIANYQQFFDDSTTSSETSFEIPTDNLPPVDECCSPENLKKGDGRLLKLFIRKSGWDCKYKENGCSEPIPGEEWEAHWKQCKFSFSFGCHHDNCRKKTAVVEGSVGHLQEKHGATVFETQGAGATIIVGFSKYTDSDPQRRFGLVKDINKYYLFGSEIDQHGMVCMWLWDMQLHSKRGWGGRKTRYSIKLELAEERQDTPPFEGTCIPYNLTSRQVIASSACLSMPVQDFIQGYVSLSEKADKVGFWSVTVQFKQEEDHFSQDRYE